jgi:hypothetical protein
MGGGSSKSSSSTTSNTNIVTNDDLTLLNKTMNNFVANTVVNQAAKCSAGMNLTQTVDLSNMVVEGDFNVSTDQSQDASVTFSCVQVSSFQNDIANGMMDKMVGALNSGYSSQALNQLSQAASANASNGFASTGAPKSDSSTNATYNFNQTTNISKDIQNVMQNEIQNNLSLSDVSDCVAQVNNAQTVNASGTKVGGNANIGVKQSQAATMVTQCIQQKDIANKVTAQVVKDLGMQTSNTVQTSNTTNTSQSATSTSESTGMFQSMGEGMATMFKGIGSMLGSIFSSPGIVIGIIVLIVIVLIGLYMKFGGGGGKGDNAPPNMPKMQGGGVSEFIPLSTQCTEGITIGKLFKDTKYTDIDFVKW